MNFGLFIIVFEFVLFYIALIRDFMIGRKVKKMCPLNIILRVAMLVCVLLALLTPLPWIPLIFIATILLFLNSYIRMHMKEKIEMGEQHIDESV